LGLRAKARCDRRLLLSKPEAVEAARHHPDGTVPKVDA
jgi:hypothetical protein